MTLATTTTTKTTKTTSESTNMFEEEDVLAKDFDNFAICEEIDQSQVKTETATEDVTADVVSAEDMVGGTYYEIKKPKWYLVSI